MSKLKPLIIFGCGSQARYVIDIASEQSIDIACLVDLELGMSPGTIINGVEVEAFQESIYGKFPQHEFQAVIAYGKNHVKFDLWHRLKKLGYEFPSIVSHQAWVSPFANISEGVIINANASIMANASIGALCVIHSGAVIEHDNILYDCVNVAPGVHLAGNVTIGARSFIYTGASVIPKVSIGEDVIVGAGACVIDDLPDNVKAWGVPARFKEVTDNQ